jgi:nucleolar protein 15
MATAIKGNLGKKRGVPEPSAATKGSKVIYLGHIPHGFYEEQMKGFFTQFGKVVRLRLSRSKKTGRSRHYAFMEFEDADVAHIVALTMNKYILFNRTLVCHVVENDKINANLWIGANRKFREVPWRDIAKRQMNAKKTPEEKQKKLKELQGKEKKKMAKLAAMGINYEYSGYAEPKAKKAKVETKSPAAKSAVAPVAAPTSSGKKAAVVEEKKDAKKVEVKKVEAVKGKTPALVNAKAAAKAAAAKEVPAVIPVSVKKAPEEKPKTASKGDDKSGNKKKTPSKK